MNETFDKFFWISFVAFVIIAAGICCLPTILTGSGGPDFRRTELLCLQLEKLPMSAEHALEKVSF